MNPLTEARQHVAGIAEAQGWATYGSPPEVTTLPALITSPGDPWAAPITWSKTEVGLQLSCAVTQAGSNESAYERLEDAVWNLLASLRKGGVIAGQVSQPHQVTFGQAQALVVDMAVRLQVDDEPMEVRRG